MEEALKDGMRSYRTWMRRKFCSQALVRSIFQRLL